MAERKWSQTLAIVGTVAGVVGAGVADAQAEETFDCKVDLFQTLDIERASGNIRDGRGPFKITIAPSIKQPQAMTVKHKFLGQDQSYLFTQPDMMTSSFVASAIEFGGVLTVVMETNPNNKHGGAYGATFVIQLPSAMHAWTLVCVKK